MRNIAEQLHQMWLLRQLQQANLQHHTIQEEEPLVLLQLLVVPMSFQPVAKALMILTLDFMLMVPAVPYWLKMMISAVRSQRYSGSALLTELILFICQDTHATRLMLLPVCLTELLDALHLLQHPSAQAQEAFVREPTLL